MFSRAQLLASAKASPAAVASHDKKAWLELFSSDAEVHDPVGSQAHCGPEALDRFYETFIAPNQIHFNVERDIVCDSTVVRDLVIETKMGGTPLQVNVPLFIRYEIIEQNGEPKVHRLYAHWELLPMMTQQVFSQGLGAGMIALVKLSQNMIRHQGLRGALGFSRAFGGAGAKAKRTVTSFLQAMAAGDDMRASTLLRTPCPLSHAGRTSKLAELGQSMRDMQWRKMLAGGAHVCVALQMDQTPAVALFDMAPDGRQITRLRIYAEQN